MLLVLQFGQKPGTGVKSLRELILIVVLGGHHGLRAEQSDGIALLMVPRALLRRRRRHREIVRIVCLC